MFAKFAAAMRCMALGLRGLGQTEKSAAKTGQLGLVPITGQRSSDKSQITYHELRARGLRLNNRQEAAARQYAQIHMILNKGN